MYAGIARQRSAYKPALQVVAGHQRAQKILLGACAHCTASDSDSQSEHEVFDLPHYKSVVWNADTVAAHRLMHDSAGKTMSANDQQIC